MSEHGPLAQGRAVPPAIPELVLAFVDAQLGALADDDDGVGPRLTEGPLTGRQSRDLVADDVRAQSDHGGQRPVQREREREINDRGKTVFYKEVYRFWLKQSSLGCDLSKTREHLFPMNKGFAKLFIPVASLYT